METIAIIGIKGIPKNFVGTSGIEAYVEHYIPELLKQGSVTCYVRKWANGGNITSYKKTRILTISTINTKHLDTVTYSLIASAHAAVTHDIVWYHGIGPAFFSFIPKIFGKRVYTTVHSLDWQRSKWGPFTRFILRISEFVCVLFSDKIFVVSNSLAEYFTIHYHKTTLIKKYPIIFYAPVKCGPVHKRYNLRTNSYILYMGRIVPEKRIEWLIRSSNTIPKLTLVIAGGPSHTDSYLKYLQTLPESKRVVFTGYVFGSEKKQLLSNCRVFVLPSEVEGYPISVAEAIGFHKKCLLNRNLQMEFGGNEKGVTYFDPDDYEDFDSKLRHITTD